MNELTDKQRTRLLIIVLAVGIPLFLLFALLWGKPQDAPTAGLRISELMNHNRTVLADETGAYYDWVEIQNIGTYTVSLDGFTLTDDPDRPNRFALDGTVLKPQECITVYLTGDKKETRFLHASFGLSSSGDTVYLCKGDTVIDQLSIGESPEDISFGRQGDITVWYATPTPSKPNTGICAETIAALRDLCYTGVMISEVSAVSAADETDWVELKNTTDAPLSLSGYRLTESPEEEGFVFDDVTLPAGGYYTLACDASTPEAVTPCAPFSLGRFGSTLYLYTKDGVLCDSFETGKQRDGVTSGRAGNDRTTRVYFKTPTKNAANSTAYSGYAPEPVIRRSGGYVENGTTVSITVPTGCRVYYTVNGSTPTADSTAYTAGQTVTVSKTAVLRAIAYCDGCLPSDIVTQTYLVTEKHDLPVLSVSGNYADLFGTNGVFTKHNNDELYALVHTEYFSVDGVKQVDFDSTLKISGGLSRYNPQKAFSLKLNQTTGVSSVSYPFFADSTLTEFSDLLLRPSGSDWSNAKLRDEFCATALKNTEGQVIQSASPVALYINGTYRGLYYLRERRNEDFISAYTGIPKENVQLAKNPAVFEWGVKGDPDMEALVTYAKKHDLTDPEHYHYVMSQINADSLMRYFIIQTFFGNGDMINNIACYRDNRGGKWNWIIFDMDWACTSYYVNHRFIEQLYTGNGQNTFQNYYYPLMTKLLKNEEFAARFVELYADMMNTTLSADRLIPILDKLADAIRSEIPRQYERYGAPSATRFEQQTNYMRTFLKNRKASIIKQLKSVFDISDEEWERLAE